MDNCVMIKKRVMAENVDSYNRTVKCSEDLQQGTAVTLKMEAKEGSEVFTATKATKEGNIWMVYSPEVMKLMVGGVYGGKDVRYFINKKNEPCDAFRPAVGDIIQVSKSFFYTGNDPKTISGATVVELDENGWNAKVSATSPEKPIFNILKKEPIMFAQAGIGDEAVDAWILECVNN